VPTPEREVPDERQGGRWSERDDSACASFAAADGDQAAGQIEVAGLKCDDLARSGGSLEHEPDDCLVTAMMEALGRPVVVGSSARRDERSELVLGEWIDDRLIELGCFHSQAGLPQFVGIFGGSGGRFAWSGA
jgi:hypothetical protein